MEAPWVSMSEIKLISPNNPIARDVLEIQRRYPARIATRSRRPQLGDIAIEEVYIYPPPEPERVWVRQSFRVIYYRQGETNNWRATTERGELFTGS
jgi:hypothetical protein